MSCDGLTGSELQVCQAAQAAQQAAEAARQAAEAAARLAEGDGAVERFVAVLDAVGSFLIPAALIVLLFKLWPVLRSIFETRRFTVKIAGFELSAQEVTDQLRSQIEDLQAKVTALEEDKAQQPDRGGEFFDPGPPDESRRPPYPQPSPAPPTARHILWVDDNPAGNAALIAALREDGIEVDTALSTAQGLAQLSARPERFAAVITDQGRLEDGAYRSSAGTELIRAMREGGLTMPIAVFTSARGVRMGDAARQAGADLVTSSALDIRGFVRRHIGAAHAD